ncbi:hypothetical protein J7E79_14325 [Bacillus sp. ISL-40]|uniref:hypothetical protein n=1 Tax=unclassified Bacillus (in: firmicutes) TaxID=185979 RepID=UPI001BEC91E4|nr:MULTISPECIES: hypothetical protein [unclassified Bacillus (in: firmicutes)]MBT2698586.1 hypothetical protein [Bacillus sp. ISL-40]MBT2720219.1 hypothetical protein [Bacillus sp. ISL-46]MBT2739188.1 hypothetical protein [Bacillus sp. ISL-77]
MSQLSELLSNQHNQNVEDLKELLRIPSISSLSEHKEDIQKAASWIANKLESIGMDHDEIVQTKGHPIIYGDWLHQENAPTVLVYGHYDVQPVDPVHLNMSQDEESWFAEWKEEMERDHSVSIDYLGEDFYKKELIKEKNTYIRNEYFQHQINNILNQIK